MSGFGFVYVLMNSAMPGLYKIGSTERSPHRRAEELSRGTGVPTDYEVVCYFEFSQAALREKEIHRALDDFRVNNLREFFKCPLIKIIELIQDDGGFFSSWDGEAAFEAKNPGRCRPGMPLWFEACLHEPGYLERVRRETLQ